MGVELSNLNQKEDSVFFVLEIVIMGTGYSSTKRILPQHFQIKLGEGGAKRHEAIHLQILGLDDNCEVQTNLFSAFCRFIWVGQYIKILNCRKKDLD